MDKMNNKPLFNIEEFLDTDIHVGGFWTRQRYPGLDSLLITPAPPWERAYFVERHFKLLKQREWFLPRVVTDGVDPALLTVYRITDKPLTLMVVSNSRRKPIPWDKTWVPGPSFSFYRLKWRIWWRKIDPRKDKRLRVILSGAMALDALAGREP